MKKGAETGGSLSWQDFVIEYGARAKVGDLATVLQQPQREIMRLRSTGVCRRNIERKGFAELFSLRHGRPPMDEEWSKPRKMGSHGTYEWLGPELALLASLVGTISKAEIATVMTERLRKVTGDPTAERGLVAVQITINRIGLKTTDVVGGITTAEAGREIGTRITVHQAIESGQLQARRVGRLWVIPHDAWAAWKAAHVLPPAGYVRLSTLRLPLGIRSDKLSEYARMGLIATATRCNPFGKGASTQFGTWWVDRKVAEMILADRRAGEPMPWHKRYDGNLRVSFKLWKQRQHPAECATCKHIWGRKGAPTTFDDYAARYPDIAHGAKRHLTRHWTPGLTITEVAAQAGRDQSTVRAAIKAGMLAMSEYKGRQYVSRTDATRWRARKCQTGDNQKSWISIDTAVAMYFFTKREIAGFIKAGKLQSKIGTNGTMRGIVYVSRHQCGHLREKIGFTEQEAARRLGITVARFRHLLEGVDWRKAERIPLVTVQAVRKRMESRHGYTIEEAAAALAETVQWVKDRIEDGTARVSRAKWDIRLIYIGAPMFKRLAAAKVNPTGRERLSADWLRVGAAALEAGVTPATIMKWGNRGELPKRQSNNGWRYHREAVRTRARTYWKTIRFHRAAKPEWLRAECSSASESALLASEKTLAG